MTPAQLQTLLASFKKKHVLVVGDAVLDINIYGKARGISAETPTLVMEALDRKDSLGGAGCVWRNLNVLRADTQFMRPHVIPNKTRYWVDSCKLFQVDTFPEAVKGTADQFDTLNDGAIVVVADYRHGFIDEPLARHITDTAKGPLFVSSQVSQEESNHHWYSSLKTVFVVNEKEKSGRNPSTLCDYEITTRGALGCLKNSGRDGDCQAIPITPIDTCGAGDAFLAAYVLSRSLEFANIWAGLSCLMKGANPPTIDMLTSWVEEHQ